MTEQNCPSSDVLRDYLAGLGDQAARRAVGGHLQQCAVCRQSVSAMSDVTEERLHPTVGMGEDALDVAGCHLELEGMTSVATGRTPTDPSQEEIAARFDASLLEAPRQPSLLGHLGKYEVQEVLGYGGMGVVLKARDEQLFRTVAIKVMSRDLASCQTSRRRFIREARAAAAINHPHVVTIHAVEERNGTPFLVMEFIRGQSLRDRLKNGPRLALVDVLRIGAEIASGLAAAHAHGVIHRDIKPGNIMLEEGMQRVKITDFGLARVAMDNVDLTSQAAGLGTPAYMSPEQVKGEPVDQRSDLFALGCVMYAMLRGHSPFHGRTALEIARNVADHDPSPPLSASNTPRFLVEIIDRLLHKSPDKRFQSASEVADLLTRHLAIINQTPTDKLQEVLKRVSATSRRTNRWQLAAYAAVIVAALGIAGIVGWRAQLLRPLPANTGITTIADGNKDESAGPAKVVPAGPKLITVSQDGSADHASFGAALAQAGPGTTIRIMDNAEYREPLVLSDGTRLQGLTIEGAGASPPTFVKPEEPDSLVTISDVAGVTLRRLRLRQVTVLQQQHAVVLRGSVAGLTLDRLVMEGDSMKYALVFVRGARGEPERPIVIRDSQIDSELMGIVIESQRATEPAQYVQVIGNRFQGAATHAQVNRAARGIRITGNIFVGGTGVALGLADASAAGEITIANNTFFDNDHWLQLRRTSSDVSGILIANNLILDCASGDVPAMSEALGEFVQKWKPVGNHWETGSQAVSEGSRGFAEIHGRIETLSRQPHDPNFLRIKTKLAPALVESPGVLPYVGALPPEG